MATYQVLPFKAYSDGTGNDTDGWADYNADFIAFPVIARKGQFAVPAHELPNDTYGSKWAQDVGQLTYFTPGTPIAPAWVCVYLNFGANMIGQTVKITLENSNGTSPIVLQDTVTISYVNGSYVPVIQVCQLANLDADVSYWIQVEFGTTINKAPGFYGEDGIEGIQSKYWWSISEAPVSDQYKTADPTELG